jgi:diguanylate cyclase (GGDEF)-like protein
MPHQAAKLTIARANMLAPLLGATLVALAALFAGAVAVGLAVNRHADQREEQLVGGALRAADPEAAALMGLPDLRIEPVKPTEAGRLSAPVGAGMFATWSSAELGFAALAQLSPLLLGLAAALAVGGAWMLAHARRFTEDLLASEAHAHHLSLHDPLTGLANRALFSDRLSLAIDQLARGGGMVGVFCIDLDKFKQVNDTLGHQAGDEMIKEAGRRLQATCRRTDTVARLGGDEYAIIAGATEREGLEILCDRIMSALSGQLDLPGGQAMLGCSMGVTIISDDFTDADEVIRQADLALYRAKAEGRGRYSIYGAEMDETQRQRQQMEVELREALSDERLQVHYQPRFSSAGVMEGVEALVRWTHPRRGAISPSAFIPVAEECGLIHDIGAYVMREACRTLARWPHLTLSVNVSPVELARQDFLDRVRAITRETGVDPRRIEIEITEGALLKDDMRTQHLLRDLRALGFQLALDDFGTGYSSLSYLHLYPVDRIKIDRSFVSNLGNLDVEKLVRAMIQLAHALDLEVTAEGVETEAQALVLVSAGCRQLQGFLLARPGDADDIDHLIATRPQAAQPLQPARRPSAA